MEIDIEDEFTLVMKDKIIVELLTETLNCGYMDVEFMLDLIDDFEVDVSDVIERIDDLGTNKDCNTIIWSIFDTAVENAVESIDIDEDLRDEFREYVEDHMETYINYLDSDLYFKIEDEDGTDYISVDNKDVLEDAINRLYETFEKEQEDYKEEEATPDKDDG